jgi:hypothetical protein
MLVLVTCFLFWGTSPGTTKIMKKLAFFVVSLILIFIEPLWANPEYLFRGRVTASPDNYMLFDDLTHREYRIFTRTRSIFQTLIQLETDDYISGAANLDPEGRLVITSIDFVGLKRLLGVWADKQHIMNFESISSLNFWNFESGLIPRFWGPYNYTYSITPDDKGKWKVFFSDDKNVILALLHCIDQNHITISVYDSNDGSIDKIYELERP